MSFYNRGKNAKKIKILFIEDLPTDVELAERTLKKAGLSFIYRTVETEREYRKELKEFAPDIIISDYKMPNFDGMNALKIAIKETPATPFIVLTGSMNEEIAVECMKQGAWDYVIKENIIRLPFAVSEALKLKEIKLEKIAAEEKLKESEEKYRAAFLTSPDAVNINKLDGAYVDINRGFTRLTGYTKENVIGKLSSEIDIWAIPSDREKLIDGLKKYGYVSNLESIFRCKDGSLKTALMSASLITINGEPHILSITRDITEAKKTQMLLAESEEKFRRLVMDDLTGDFISTPEGKFILVNPALANILGFDSMDELMQTNLLSLYKNPEDRFKLLNELKAKKKLENYEITVLRKDGKEINVVENIVGEFDDKGNLIQLKGYLYDITERKKSEREIKKLNRVYAVLSSINEVIVRVKDKQILLEEACRIAVEKGNFKLAWVGIREEKNNKVIPVAFAGDSKDYLDSLSINLNDDKEKQGPFGRVIDKGVRAIVNNIAEDLSMLPWREKALKSGYNSVGSFPIKIFGKTIGAFNIYAAETDFFDEAELKLFDELAEDISFAVEYIETETSKKKYEESLRESESKNRAILDAIPDMVFLIDAKGNFIDYKAPSDSDLYTRRNNIIGKNLKDILPKEVSEMIFRNIEKTLELGTIQTFEYALTLAGSVQYYEARMACSDKENLVVVVRNITDRKRSEEELRKLLRAVEQSPASVVITDTNGFIQYVNEKFCEVTGYEKEEVIGLKPNVLKSGYHDSFFYENLWNTILSGEEWHGEILNKKKNGELYWESASISPVFDNNENITHFVAVKEDITEKKKMVEELIKAKEEAEVSEKIKTEFLSQMSHEIRTPINVIIGNLSLIREDLCNQIDATACELFDGIDLSVKRIMRTIDLILNMSEIQTNSYKPIFRTIDLKTDILNKIIEEFKTQAKNKNLGLYLDCLVEDTKLIGDEYSITQIFANLMDNAIKYTHKGKIDIIIDRNYEGELTAQVRDTGIGMSREFIADIFKPFTQEERGYTRTYEGNGLGLALVKRYCEINNISIEVESEKGKGSLFRLVFKKKPVLL
ncbi:PAS domain S-box protein [Melioribacter roseus]|uniref:PAS domain S-box protein n=1 Tax=Melioribacter roseus TaxID=1134405 RepID=UPI0002D562BB|nr:PAS domain S-box protein [Melioribacter roseus]